MVYKTMFCQKPNFCLSKLLLGSWKSINREQRGNKIPLEAANCLLDFFTSQRSCAGKFSLNYCLLRFTKGLIRVSSINFSTVWDYGCTQVVLYCSGN